MPVGDPQRQGVLLTLDAHRTLGDVLLQDLCFQLSEPAVAQSYATNYKLYPFLNQAALDHSLFVRFITELTGQADRLKEGLRIPVEVVPQHVREVTSQLLRAKDERIAELEARLAAADALGGNSKRSSDIELAAPAKRHCSLSKPTCTSAISAETCTLQDMFSACKGQNPLSAGGHLSALTIYQKFN